MFLENDRGLTAPWQRGLTAPCGVSGILSKCRGVILIHLSDRLLRAIGSQFCHAN